MANTTEQAAAFLRERDKLEILKDGTMGHLIAVEAIRDALAQPAQEPEQAPDTSQDWAKLDGATAFHLIERHADDWSDARNMMETWAKARFPQPSAPVAQTTGDHDFPVDLVERLRKACTRMGIATSPSLEECSLKLDALLYALCRAIESHYERISTAPQVEAKEGWKLFGAKVLECAREGMGEVDGGCIQDWAVEAGLLVAHQETEPCGEGCRCAEYGIDFPWECFRYSDEAKATIDSLAAPSSQKEGEQPK